MLTGPANRGVHRAERQEGVRGTRRLSEIAPYRMVFALPRYRRGTAERLTMPVLMCLADHDLEASSRYAARGSPPGCRTRPSCTTQSATSMSNKAQSGSRSATRRPASSPSTCAPGPAPVCARQRPDGHGFSGLPWIALRAAAHPLPVRNKDAAAVSAY